jgi:hypothetical protein
MAIDNKIVADILEYVGSAKKSEWYVGIATDVQDRLFSGHNVPEKGSQGWIYRTASSEQNARDTEKHLLNTYSFKGGAGGGDCPKCIYAYKITGSTKE